MQSSDYKRITSNPDAFQRQELTYTIDALRISRPKGALRLEQIMKTPPIPKPPFHPGGIETDYFQVAITEDEASQIVEGLGILEGSAVSPDGDTTPAATKYGVLLGRWSRYVFWLQQGTL